MLLFVFLDGVGLGVRDVRVNPFMAARTPFLESLLGAKLSLDLADIQKPDFVFKQLDACLGYPGLPQSATGQTTLLTGKNGAEIMQGHYGPWPGPTLKQALDAGTLFTELANSEVVFSNAYPPGFFKALETKRQKLNVPAYAAQAAGLKLLTHEDYLAGQGVSVDLTGDYLGKYDARVLSPYEMGERLNRQAQRASLSFFDYWPSDSVGHRGSFAEAVALIEKLDSFLAGVAAELSELTLLITSDHGNLEDKTVKTHTLSAVPLIALGPGAQAFKDALSLLDVAPAIRQMLDL